MFVFRLIALTSLVFALMMMGADIISTMEMGGGVVVRSLSQVMMLFGFDASNIIQAILPQSAVGFGMMLIDWPGWLTLGVFGLLLTNLTRPRRYYS